MTNLTRRGVAAVFFSGYALAAVSAQAAPIHTDEAGRTIETVTLPAPDGFALPAYVARPKARGRFPAVIVASEISASTTTSRTFAAASPSWVMWPSPRPSCARGRPGADRRHCRGDRDRDEGARPPGSLETSARL